MILRTYNFPVPDRLVNIPENVISVDLGRHVGFATILNEQLICGCKTVKLSEWRTTSNCIRELNNEYENLCQALIRKFPKINLILLEQNVFFLVQRRSVNPNLAYFVKMQMMSEALFIAHFPCEVRYYYGSQIKKRNFSTSKQRLVNLKIKELLGVTKMSDHVTDSIAGLYSLKRSK